MNIAKRKNLWLGIALVFALLSVVLLSTKGLNLGIDFTGGTLIERRLPVVTNGEELLGHLAKLENIDLGKPTIQMAGQGQNAIIRTRHLENDEIDQIDALLKEVYGEVEIRRTEVVGPIIGEELINKALWSLTLAALMILIYIGFRFEFTFGVAAVLALLHDVLITCGVFSLLGMEINSNFVAAILTIVGYSINDTIVTFDRIRENRRFSPKADVGELVETSISQSLSRTINTSLTTLLVLVSLFFLGGSSIRDFVFALILGVLVGTFSTLFIASPLWLTLRQRKDASTGKSVAKAN
ncbi:MAG: protein translocase subunit SecF [Limnochordia bacterium]|nr:protein translocase subunit SecF [Limnochordia bacterium]